MRKFIWLGLLFFIVAAIGFYVGRNFGAHEIIDEVMAAHDMDLKPPIYGRDVVALCLPPSDAVILASVRNGIAAGDRTQACVSFVQGVAAAAVYAETQIPESRPKCGALPWEPDVHATIIHLKGDVVLMDRPAGEAVTKSLEPRYVCSD